MKIMDCLALAKVIMQARFLGRKTPFVVTWSLTDRCTLQCKYCNRWNKNSPELDTGQIFSIIDELASLKGKRIVFTGGEPLIREDIADIVSHAAGKGMQVIINSNGDLIPDKVDILNQVFRFVLSLDGPEFLHDSIRGKGSHARVIDAIAVLKERGQEVELVTVITKANAPDISQAVLLAEQLKVRAYFQPVSYHLMDKQFASEVLPDQVTYRSAIEKLLLLKERGNKHIGNSKAALRHIYDWPRQKPLKCSLGRVGLRIDTNADLSYCDRPNLLTNYPNCSRQGVGAAFRQLPPIVCESSCCGKRLELNYLFNLNFDCIVNAMQSEAPLR